MVYRKTMSRSWWVLAKTIKIFFVFLNLDGEEVAINFPDDNVTMSPQLISKPFAKVYMDFMI